MNDALSLVAGLPTLPVEAYEAGIDAGHALWHLIRAVWINGVDVTAEGIVWINPQTDLVLAVKLGSEVDGPRVVGTRELRGHIELELKSDLFSRAALSQFELFYPELAGHVKAPGSSAEPRGAAHGA